MGIASAVHLKDMDTVLILNDQTSKFSEYRAQFTGGQEAFIHGLLAAGAVALEDMPDLREPPLTGDVICYEVEYPFHKDRIAGIARCFSKSNIAAILSE